MYRYTFSIQVLVHVHACTCTCMFTECVYTCVCIVGCVTLWIYYLYKFGHIDRGSYDSQYLFHVSHILKALIHYCIFISHYFCVVIFANDGISDILCIVQFVIVTCTKTLVQTHLDCRYTGWPKNNGTAYFR